MIDEKLIDLCRNGDANAQKILYEQFAVKMFRTCYRYVKNECDAEDILVEGFFKVFNNLSKFEMRGEKSLEAWIRRIMINESLMFLRKQHNYKMVPAESISNLGSNSLSEVDLYAEDIYKLVRRLPTGYRTVFNLYVVEGYSHREIAEQLSISENTSKSQLSKAKAWLRKLLNQNGISNES